MCSIVIPSACTELSEYFVELVVTHLSLPACQYVQVIALMEFCFKYLNISFKIAVHVMRFWIRVWSHIEFNGQIRISAVHQKKGEYLVES